jgi:hypothetical protein
MGGRGCRETQNFPGVDQVFEKCSFREEIMDANVFYSWRRRLDWDMVVPKKTGYDYSSYHSVVPK